ncbi:MAG: hypothetical protein J3K34DRAFT_513375 [Monoraphidium minutum]|nr:MAG: hypothetical protein J3K34DRAFT_513375 [Monoraphidium minutum]
MLALLPPPRRGGRAPRCGSRGAAALVCCAWRAALARGVTVLTAAPLAELPRLLARFPAAAAAGVCDAAGGAAPLDAPAVAAALLACPRPLARLAVAPSHSAAAPAALALLAGAGAPGAVWARALVSLDLDATFLMRLPPGFGASLPALARLTVRNFRNGGHGLEPLLAAPRLRRLALVSVHCSSLAALDQIMSLTRLDIESAYNLRELPPPPPALEVLSVCGCHALSELHLGAAAFPALASLTLRDCPALFAPPAPLPPAAVAAAAAAAFAGWAAARLPGLGELASLRSLDLSANAALRRLPAGVAALQSLTRLSAAGARLDDCPAAGAGPALAPALACRALEELVLRGCRGVPDGAAVALPGGIASLSRLQTLDLGGASRFAPLPPALSRLPALRVLALPPGAGRARGGGSGEPLVGWELVRLLERRARGGERGGGGGAGGGDSNGGDGDDGVEALPAVVITEG